MSEELGPVEAKLKDLNQLLMEEIEIHEALKIELQQEAARDGELNGADLLKLQQGKIRKMREIQGLELKRMQLVDELAAAWNEDPAELTLRRIVPRASAEIGERLAACHEQLVALVESIRELARETAGNAQARLKAIDATLAVINEAIKMHPTYSEEGRLQKVTPSFKETSA